MTDSKTVTVRYTDPRVSDVYQSRKWGRQLRHTSGMIFVVALPNGAFSTSGLAYEIDENRDCYGRRCLFETREAALRHAVARFIRDCRCTRRFPVYQGIERGHAPALIAWAKTLIRRPTGLPPY